MMISHSIGRYLIASYCYYLYDKSIMKDSEYDLLGSDILRNWDTIKHPHKKLLSKAALKAGTAFHLKERDYPLIVVNKAHSLMLEQKYLESLEKKTMFGVKVSAFFRLCAISEIQKTKNGKSILRQRAGSIVPKDSKSIFLTLEFWEKKADMVFDFASKGQMIFVEGYLKDDSFTKDDGTTFFKMGVSVQDFQLCQRSGESVFKDKDKENTDNSNPQENKEDGGLNDVP